jgi:SlyX protein
MSHDASARPPDASERRLTALEEVCTHIERLVQDLNRVILRQQQQLDALERRVERLASGFDAMAQRLPEDRRPEEERPPHY